MKTLDRCAALVSVMLLAGCSDMSVGHWGWNIVKGSGTIHTETRAVSGFDQVVLAGSGDLKIVQGNEESLTITADDNLLPLIQSEVRNGKLWIGPRKVNLRPTQTIRYTLKLKDLSRLALSGSVRASADTLKAGSLNVDLSGSGTIRVGTLETESCTMTVSGSGRLELGGRTQSFKVVVSGSGDCRAMDLHCRTAEIRISGSGKVRLAVTDKLDAWISGSGSVRYQGRPRVTSHISGSGSITSTGAAEHDA